MVNRCATIERLPIEELSPRFSTVRFEACNREKCKNVDFVGEIHTYRQEESNQVFRTLIGYDSMGLENVNYTKPWSWGTSVIIWASRLASFTSSGGMESENHPALSDIGGLVIAQKKGHPSAQLISEQFDIPLFGECELSQSSLEQLILVETRREPSVAEKKEIIALNLLAAFCGAAFMGVALLAPFIASRCFFPERTASVANTILNSLGWMGSALRFLNQDKGPGRALRFASYAVFFGVAAFFYLWDSEAIVDVRNEDMVHHVKRMAAHPKTEKMIVVVGKEHLEGKDPLKGIVHLLEGYDEETGLTFRRVRQE